MKKKCIECADEFHGRVDAKFCSDSCRSSYHNRISGQKRIEVQRINAVLRRNYRILSKLNINDTSRVRREELLKKGFDFDYLTNIYRTSKGKVYFFCYDQGYLNEKGEYVTLVKRKDYVR